MSQQQNYAPPCGCGRSPTGYCVGWHNLTVETFDKRLKEWNEAKQAAEAQQLLKEEK